MDGDKVGRDSVAPPQLPRDAPVSTNSKGQSGGSGWAPQLASLIIGPYKGKKKARIQYLSGSSSESIKPRRKDIWEDEVLFVT